MKWATWAPVYQAILDDFKFDRKADEDARDDCEEPALELLDRHVRESFRVAMGGHDVWIVGPTATEADVRAIPEGAPVLVTDAGARLALGILRPVAIVTDLDGDVEAQVRANAAGVLLFIHAHGDNREALKRYLPQMTGPAFITTQAGPHPPVWNHGGFTDGDRAACIAEAFGAKSLTLVGFDFEHPAPKPGLNVEMKRRKLAWARRIIEMLTIPVNYAVSASTHDK